MLPRGGRTPALPRAKGQDCGSCPTSLLHAEQVDEGARLPSTRAEGGGRLTCVRRAGPAPPLNLVPSSPGRQGQCIGSATAVAPIACAGLWRGATRPRAPWAGRTGLGESQTQSLSVRVGMREPTSCTGPGGCAPGVPARAWAKVALSGRWLVGGGRGWPGGGQGAVQGRCRVIHSIGEWRAIHSIGDTGRQGSSC